MLFKNGTKIVEAESIYKQLVPLCSETLKAGHITLIKSAGMDNSIMDILKRAGYKVAVIEPAKNVMFSYNSVKALILQEESRLVVAIGEDYIMDCAKVLAATNNVQLILIPLDFSALCAMQKRAEFFSDEEGLLSYNPQEPPIVLLCRDYLLSQSSKKLSQGLGYIMAYLVWAFDTLYECIIHNKGINPKITALIRKIITVFSDLNTLELATSIEVILKTAIEISETVSDFEIGSATAILFGWLISLYKKEKVSYNNYTFLASFLIIETYRKINLLDNVLLPPDRNVSLQALNKNCGFDYREQLRQAKIGYAEDYNRRCYVSKDYIEELQTLLKGDWLYSAAKYYRRLQGSSGYNMRKIICSEDMLMLMALAGEECGGYPLLKHIKISGLLERYL